jgi:PPM family protein phosphatase
VGDEDDFAPEMRVLLRSIGAEGTNDPEVNGEICWSPGDRFIRCSGGLHGIGKSLSTHEVRSAAQEALDPPALANRLITDALGRGGQDNITAVVVQVQ